MTREQEQRIIIAAIEWGREFAQGHTSWKHPSTDAEHELALALACAGVDILTGTILEPPRVVARSDEVPF